MLYFIYRNKNSLYIRITWKTPIFGGLARHKESLLSMLNYPRFSYPLLGVGSKQRNKFTGRDWCFVLKEVSCEGGAAKGTRQEARELEQLCLSSHTRHLCRVLLFIEDLWILQASVPVMNNKHDELTVIRSIHSVTMSCPPFSSKCLVSSPSSFSDTDLCRSAQDCAMTLSASRNFYKTLTFLQAWNERVFRFCSTSPSLRELGRCYRQLKENVKNSLTRARDCPLESR